MSKLKLLLLGGIFTLVGIFNFSSAETFYGNSFTCSVGGQIEGYTECSDDSLEFNPYIEGEYVLNIATTLNSFEATILVGNGYFNSTNTPSIGGEIIPGNYNFSCNDDEDEKGCMRVNPFSYSKLNGDTPALITYTVSKVGGEGGEGGQIISGGFDNFIPAVEGVKTTVNQIIPLMVFIGIGVLVVTLGFIAIRWLVNWLGGKIRSVFKSKRG